MTETLSFIGLGKLGLCMATCFAMKGYKVIGIDINENIVKSLNKGIAPIIEPHLQENITKAGNYLRATTNYEDVISKTDITFIMVATPSKPDGSFSNEYVEASLINLAQMLKKSDKKYHIFVVSSTVMPGSIEESFIPLIEKYSGRKLNDGFGLCYSPDLVALGKVFHDYLNPDLVILGQSSKFAGDKIAAIHHRVVENNAPVFQMSLIDAQIAKVAVNCYITYKISFANALANICEAIPGADIDLITQAIGADRRISPYYLKGGLSFGGTCFPRDTIAYRAIAKKYGYKDELMAAIERVNKYQDDHLFEITLKHNKAAKDKTVAVLGLAFKQDTPVIIESPGITLVTKLLAQNVKVIGYDPLAMENTRAVFGDKITYANSVKECITKAGVCVITTPDNAFKQIDASYITGESLTIIDCWRILNPSKFNNNVKYVAWAKNNRILP